MKTFYLFLILIIMTLAGSACGAQPSQPPAETAAPQTAASPTAMAEQQNTSADTLLLWEGSALFAENPTECHRLQITADNQILLGPCNGEQKAVQFLANHNQEWPEILARFAPFQLETPTERIIFNGRGQVSGPAWQRAITAWAQLAHAELASGRVSAAGHTVLAWNLGEQPGQANQCRMLLVLVHGYATAGLTPCEGGQMQALANNWLDTADWEQFDAWLYNRAPLYQDNNYLDGRGSAEMNDAEVAALAGWAEAVYAKLTQTGSIDAPPTEMAANPPPAVCLTPNSDQQLLLDETNGYCLLYPARYTLAQTTPNATEIVIDSVMNHIDPRASIGVEPANGRSLAAVVAQLEADYAPPGFNIERSSITVAGVEAVVLDNLPGQDLNRRVAFIQNERLYSLFFAPIGEPGSNTRQQAESLYQQVVDSFRFLEPTRPTPTPTPMPTATPQPQPAEVTVLPTQVQYVMALVDLNIRSGPGTTYPVIGSIFGGQIALVTGITADNQWWRVICPNDTVGNCFVSASPNLTQPTTAPGHTPPPTPVEETGKAVIEAIDIQILESFPVQVQAAVSGYLPDVCTSIARVNLTRQDFTFRVQIVTSRQPNTGCALQITPFTQVVPLEMRGLPAGQYQVVGNNIVAAFSWDGGGEPVNNAPEWIYFAPGATSAQVYGYTMAIAPKRYLLRAQGGQVMRVNLDTASVHTYITVLTPYGENMAGADGPIHNWSGTLPASGDYMIEVINSGAGSADFGLTVTIE